MRKLTLKKETVTELTSDQLDQVAGGSGLSCFLCQPQSDFQECITGLPCLSVRSC